NKRVECTLCPRACTIADMERGYCGVRENQGGTYYTLVYGRACAAHIDPIEKKPLFHYLPGTPAYSIATAGCNIECRFCQNWEISQFRPEQVRSIDLPPKQVVSLAKRHGCKTIAYTYTEPVVFYEYMYDTAIQGNKVGIGSVIISNGYIKKEPMKDLCQHLSAVKIDLKAFTEKFYHDTCSGHLKPVLECLELLAGLDIWYEIVVLIVPTLNDSEKEIKDMCKWVKANLGPDVPMHFSRFYPTYKIKNLPPTPPKTLERARQIARSEGINYVYVGNVPGNPGESTHCPHCDELLIHRIGYRIRKNSIKDSKCPNCGQFIPGVWKPISK
ncbi:MAG: radical SAM protein, partial [Planctomycetes bacterium DG_23]